MSSSIVRPGVPIDRYPGLWRGIDIALCPLNPIDFNRAKSALKGMESSAAGVPFIASDLDEIADTAAVDWPRHRVSGPTTWRHCWIVMSDRSLQIAPTSESRSKTAQSGGRDWEELYAALGTVDCSVWARLGG